MRYLLALILQVVAGVDAKERLGRRRWDGHLEGDVNDAGSTERGVVDQSLQGDDGVLREKRGLGHFISPHARVQQSRFRELYCLSEQEHKV